VFTSFFGLMPEARNDGGVNTELLARHSSMFVMGGFMGRALARETMSLQFSATL
jgi:hypothetical protein